MGNNAKLLAAAFVGALAGGAAMHSTPAKSPVVAPKITAECGCWDIERDELSGFLLPHEKYCAPGQRKLCGDALKAKFR